MVEALLLLAALVWGAGTASTVIMYSGDMLAAAHRSQQLRHLLGRTSQPASPVYVDSFSSTQAQSPAKPSTRSFLGTRGTSPETHLQSTADICGLCCQVAGVPFRFSRFRDAISTPSGHFPAPGEEALVIALPFAAWREPSLPRSSRASADLTCDMTAACHDL